MNVKSHAKCGTPCVDTAFFSLLDGKGVGLFSVNRQFIVKMSLRRLSTGVLISCSSVLGAQISLMVLHG